MTVALERATFSRMLTFLKLGGSLITDKTRPYTARLDKLDDLAHQIALALQDNPTLHLLLGHGSGSFGHAAASQYGTRQGVQGKESWLGFAEVWYQASSLNRLVVDALRHAGLPAVTLSPLSMVSTTNGVVETWDTASLQAAISHGLLPVIHGDVIFDHARGGTILSTEDLFIHLASKMAPEHILLAGLEEGVWADFPVRKTLVGEITPESFARHASGLGSSNGTDVTGGMQTKVSGMLELMKGTANLDVVIFSGETPGNIRAALGGAVLGTRLHR